MHTYDFDAPVLGPPRCIAVAGARRMFAVTAHIKQHHTGRLGRLGNSIGPTLGQRHVVGGPGPVIRVAGYNERFGISLLEKPDQIGTVGR